MKALVNLRQKNNEQLHNRINEIDNSLMRLRGRGIGVPEYGVKKGGNPMLQRSLRREKARILTILNERRNKK